MVVGRVGWRNSLGLSVGFIPASWVSKEESRKASRNFVYSAEPHLWSAPGHPDTICATAVGWVSQPPRWNKCQAMLWSGTCRWPAFYVYFYQVWSGITIKSSFVLFKLPGWKWKTLYLSDRITEKGVACSSEEIGDQKRSELMILSESVYERGKLYVSFPAQES